MWQQLLRNLGLDSLLVRAVEIPYSTFRAGFAEKGTPAGDQKDETYEVLFEVVRAAWQCVRSFVLCNAENQAIFSEHMPFLIAEMKACPELGIAEVLIEVFRDNLEMIESKGEKSIFTEARVSRASGACAISLLLFASG